MNLVDQLNQALKQAMKQRQSERLAALRLLKAVIDNQQIEKKAPLSDQETVQLLKTEAKKREEAGAIYTKAGRQELAQKEAFEFKIIGEFLPQMMSEVQVKSIVDKMKAEGKLGNNFGEAMKQVMAELKGKADGKMVAEAVKNSL